MQSHHPLAIFKWLPIIAAAIVIFSAQANAQLVLTKNMTGNHEGYHYQFWEGSGEASMTLDSWGSFVSEWGTDSGLFIAALGFDIPTASALAYSGSFDITEQGTSFLMAYGISINDSISQFFIVETAFDESKIPDSKYLATYKSDDSFYDFYKNTSSMDPSDLNSPISDNYYSIRRDPKQLGDIEGNIDLNAHYEAWARVGAEIYVGTRVFLGAYGLEGEGRVELNVREGETCLSTQNFLSATSCDLHLSVNAEALVVDENSPSNTFEGDYYTLWKSSPDDQTLLILHGEGRYEAQLSASTEEFIGGVGWKPGTPRTIEYSGSFNPDPGMNAHLSLHGWAYDPRVEYYIVETYGGWNPSDGSSYQGSYESGGATYDLYYKANPSFGIAPIQTYEYMSVRKLPKAHGNIEGKIDVQDHFDHWETLGLDMNFSEYDYMVMATWSYRASGRSDVTVKEVIEVDESDTEETGSGAGSSNIGLMVILGLLLTIARKGYIGTRMRADRLSN